MHYENDIPMPDNLDHWRPMVRYFAERCNRFRADCWPRDAATLAMFQPYVESHSLPGSSTMFVVGRLDTELLELILADPFDAEGAVKWFSLFLVRDDAIVMSSAHNGAEIFLSEVNGEELAWIQSILPQHVRLSSSSKEEMDRLRAERPAVEHGIDEGCFPNEADGQKLRALGATFFETLVEILSSATGNVPPD